MSVLTGLRVLEVSGSGAAAWACKQLADWGAEVTILEPRGGTPLRDAAPTYDSSGIQRSAAWEWLSRGKQHTELGGVLVPDARQALTSAATFDVVVVESELVEPVFGMTPVELRDALAGGPVAAFISPFGLEGPYASYQTGDLGMHALGGWCNLIGDPGDRPLRPGCEMMPRLQGVCAFVAVLLALRSSEGGGRPGPIEISGQEVAATMIVAPWLMKSQLGVEQSRRANDWLQAGLVECSDGWFGSTPLTATHWELMCRLMGMDDVIERPEGLDPNWRWAHSAELLDRAGPFLESSSKFDLFEQLQAWRIPAAPVENTRERLACPQLAARGFWEVQKVDGRELKVPRVAYRLSSVAPLGRDPVIAAVDLAPGTYRERGTPGPDPSLPFAGLRVLDLTHFWAGPFATALMGGAGADVIKVESIQRPDAFRFTFAPAGEDRWWERSPTWQDTNVNKRSLTLDLGSPEGKQLFESLIEQCDVVIENFSNRVMANLGFTPERLTSLNPRLISVSVPGFGPGGPWEDYVGYGIAFEQLVCAAVTGYEGGVPRIMSGFADPLAGLHAVAAIALALRERERSGRGCVIEVPQCEVLDSLFAPEHIAVQHGAPVPAPAGNRHPAMAPHNTYPVEGTDEWIAIAIDSDDAFAALCEVLGLAELADDACFARQPARKTHEADLDARIDGATRTWDGSELERRLQARGVMACRVNKGWRLPEDPNLRARGFFQEVERAVTGRHPYKTWPIRIGGVDLGHKRPPPTLGEHNREVLRELLGLDDATLDRLHEHQVIGEVPIGV